MSKPKKVREPKWKTERREQRTFKKVQRVKGGVL